MSPAEFFLFAASFVFITVTMGVNDGKRVMSKQEASVYWGAAVTQYPSSLKTSMLRIMISKGATIKDIKFDYPAPSNERYHYIFGKSGKAEYKKMPDVVEDGREGKWFFNANFQLKNAGTAGVIGSEIIAFLPHVKQDVCEVTNTILDIKSMPKFNAPNDDLEIKSSLVSDGMGYSAFSDAEKPYLLEGKNNLPYGCFREDTLGYVYYHVLVER